MVDNKDSYTFKKYLKNKKLIKFFYFLIVVDTILFFYFLIKLFYSSYYKYPLLATVIVLFFFIIFKFQIEETDKELEKVRKRNYFTWGRGAGAELIVKRSLMKLGDDYRIISDFQTGRGNIDHICIGPTGIFTIEVKAHRGTINYVSGKLRKNREDISDFLGQAKAESIFLNQLIKEKLNKDYLIIPVLVFPNAKIDGNINHKIENVWIGGRRFEKWVVDRCNNVLNLGEIEEICRILKNLHNMNRG